MYTHIPCECCSKVFDVHEANRKMTRPTKKFHYCDECFMLCGSSTAGCCSNCTTVCGINSPEENEIESHRGTSALCRVCSQEKFT